MTVSRFFPYSFRSGHLVSHCFLTGLSSATPVFLTGILEYLIANILDLAGKEACTNHRVRISPEHVQTALVNNENLRCLFQPGAFSQPAASPPAPEN